MSDKYYRPASQRHRTEIMVINSRFITTVQRATTVTEARDFISTVRDEMPGANHHVYAFCIGYGNSITEGMSDDGEPSGTSGPPTLAVLRGRDIGDVALVTTRYFGGTKLGTGGLVRAYTEAAQTALATLPLVYKAPKTQLGLDISYSNYEPVKRLIEQYEATIDDELFGGDVSIIATFLQDDVSQFTAELTNLTAGQAEATLLDTLDT